MSITFCLFVTYAFIFSTFDSLSVVLYTCMVIQLSRLWVSLGSLMFTFRVQFLFLLTRFLSFNCSSSRFTLFRLDTYLISRCTSFNCSTILVLWVIHSYQISRCTSFYCSPSRVFIHPYPFTQMIFLLISPDSNPFHYRCLSICSSLRPAPPHCPESEIKKHNKIITHYTPVSHLAVPCALLGFRF